MGPTRCCLFRLWNGRRADVGLVFNNIWTSFCPHFGQPEPLGGCRVSGSIQQRWKKHWFHHRSPEFPCGPGPGNPDYIETRIFGRALRGRRFILCNVHTVHTDCTHCRHSLHCIQSMQCNVYNAYIVYIVYIVPIVAMSCRSNGQKAIWMHFGTW